LEADPHRRLAFTFHTFTPQVKEYAPLTDDVIARLAGERRSRVSFDIEQDGDQVKLTVVHDEFSPDSLVRKMVSDGWPRKLADLKSGLEKA
jgi:Activator of Hsp90 ATPase homolog 1-like protein